MRQAKGILILIVGCFVASAILAQHPNRAKIDSLKKQLSALQGLQRVDCLNALSEEYWWPPRVYPDSISGWANEAYSIATNIRYDPGRAASIMHLGVAEIYRKNFLNSEKYLRQARDLYKDLNDELGLAWSNLWLGQNLYSQNSYNEATNCFATSLTYLTKLNLWEGEGKAWAWMGFLYAATGEYDSSFNYLSKSLLIRQKMSDDVCIAASLDNMGHLYRVAGDYEDALDYYRQGMNYANAHSIDFRAANWNYFDEPIGIIYRLMNEPDSSLYYLETALQIDPGNLMTRVSLGETYLAKKEYDTALRIFLPPIKHFRTEHDQWDLMRVLLDAAKAFDGEMNEPEAQQYARESFAIARQANVKQYMMEGYLVLSRIAKQLKKNDSAYYFIQHYAALKDSILNNQFIFRLANFKKQTDFRKQIEQVSLLNQDNKIKEGELRRASQLTWGLVLGLLVVALSGFFIYRNLSLKRKNDKLESQKAQSDLQLRATELEMQALRAQMNPHFIFNCLSSINRFILKSETEAASDYLTKFSRLIRMVLTNSDKPFISLEDELEMLRLYLDMERLRFKNAFDYGIRFTNSIDAGNVFVPPLLLQPFVENAIWHGLMHKEGQGLLEVAMSTDKRVMTCVISDNGIGRTRAAMMKSKSAAHQKSMGLQITAERLALLNKGSDENTFFKVEDITNEEGAVMGTKVTLKLNYRSLMEASSDRS